MTTDKERAEFYRAARNELILQNFKDAAEHFAALADELDPPKPTYPDGTIAWVTIVDFPMKKYLGVRVGDEWRDGYGPDDLRRRVCAPSVAVKVEPLRVLGDDEIAVARVDADSGALRDVAECHSYDHDPLPRMSINARAILNCYAAALDAEAGDAK